MNRFLTGMLAFFLAFSPRLSGQDTLHFVFLNTNPNREVLTKEAAAVLQQRHLANIDRLYRKNKILAAGPFADGGGFFIVSATDSTELDSLLQSDAAIRANRFVVEKHPLQLLHGTLCKAAEPFSMDTVAFIRIDQSADGGTLPWPPTGQSDALLIGSWAGAGGFAIGKSSSRLFTNWLTQMKRRSHQRATLTRRTLWYGKGTFCE